MAPGRSPRGDVWWTDGRRRSRGSSAPRASHGLWVPAATGRNTAGNFNKLRRCHQDAARMRPREEKVPPRVPSQLSRCKKGKASWTGSTRGAASPAAPAPACSAAARAPAPPGGTRARPRCTPARPLAPQGPTGDKETPLLPREPNSPNLKAVGAAAPTAEVNRASPRDP